jgi:hypothetical protein
MNSTWMGGALDRSGETSKSLLLYGSLALPVHLFLCLSAGQSVSMSERPASLIPFIELKIKHC